MRTFCIIIGSIAAVLGFLLSFFMDNFAYIPIASGVLLGIVALLLSKRTGKRESVPKLIIALSFLAGAITTMNLFKENKVAPDAKPSVEEQQNRQEQDIQEIENELDNLDFEENPDSIPEGEFGDDS